MKDGLLTVSVVPSTMTSFSLYYSEEVEEYRIVVTRAQLELQERTYYTPCKEDAYNTLLAMVKEEIE